MTKLLEAHPKISILIPTLNAQSVLETCLISIREQNYPQDSIEIVIADGGSTDNTLVLAEKYGCKIVTNPLKTAEAGKAVALKAATGEFMALVDSDNILPTSEWLNEMLMPLLENPDVVGSEPWSYTLRASDGFITRYCALIGMNDPLVHFLGNYDRLNLLTGKWTEVPHELLDKGDYLVCKFSGKILPTIGANGTVFRSDFLRKAVVGDYLFDIDVLTSTLKENGFVKFIKVKNGIVHTYCENDVSKFIRKQQRRISDFLYHKFSSKIRKDSWEGSTSENSLGVAIFANLGLIKFCLYCILVFPLVVESIIGYSRKRDWAWFFHVFACEVTFLIYSQGVVKSLFQSKEFNRQNWSQ